MADYPTIVYFDATWNLIDVKVFRTIYPENQNIWATDFKDGVVYVDPMPGEEIQNFINIIVGCFNKYSNFSIEVAKAFKSKDLPYGIEFNFNGAKILVTATNRDPIGIYNFWSFEMDENARNLEKARQEYMKTPEYRKWRAKEVKKALRNQKLQVDKLTLDRITQIEFKDEKSKYIWRHWRRYMKHDKYWNEIVGYARRWAKYMQYLIDKYGGKTVYEVAENTSYLADISNNITGAQNWKAINILSRVWKYGDELEKWNDSRYC